MTDNKEKLYWLLALSCTVLISFYPLMMGGRVITDMIMNGTVLKEDYPKYIIPYTPIAFAVITGVLFMPFHFADGPANMLTNTAIDPTAKIPELKVCAARIEKA